MEGLLSMWPIQTIFQNLTLTQLIVSLLYNIQYFTFYLYNHGVFVETKLDGVSPVDNPPPASSTSWFEKIFKDLLEL